MIKARGTKFKTDNNYMDKGKRAMEKRLVCALHAQSCEEGRCI